MSNKFKQLPIIASKFYKINCNDNLKTKIIEINTSKLFGFCKFSNEYEKMNISSHLELIFNNNNQRLKIEEKCEFFNNNNKIFYKYSLINNLIKNNNSFTHLELQDKIEIESNNINNLFLPEIINKIISIINNDIRYNKYWKDEIIKKI